MPNRNYQRGRAREYRVMKALEKASYHCVRAAGSKGLFDIVAICKEGIRLIQVKLNKGPTAEERKALSVFSNLPSNAVKEVWTFKDRCEPTVQRIGG